MVDSRIGDCPHCQGKIQVNIEPKNKTVRFQDIQGFFKYGLNPIVLKSRIENARQEERVGKRQIPTNLIMILCIVLIFGSVGYAIIMSVAPEKACCERLGQLAGVGSISQEEAKKYQEQSQSGNLLGGITGLS